MTGKSKAKGNRQQEGREAEKRVREPARSCLATPWVGGETGCGVPQRGKFLTGKTTVNAASHQGNRPHKRKERDEDTNHLKNLF